MSTFNAKRLMGLFLLILVSVVFLMNSMKESEKQKLGRLVESHCAMDGLSKNGCKIKLLLAHVEAIAKMLNSSQKDMAKRKMELVEVEKQEEALNSLGDESNDLLTASDVLVLFNIPAPRSIITGGNGLLGTFSMITRDELLGRFDQARTDKDFSLFQIKSSGIKKESKIKTLGLR